MQHFHEFTFTEQRQISELISYAWAESGELGAEPSETSPPPRPTIPIGQLLNGVRLPAANDITTARAEELTRYLVGVLARRGVVLHGAKWLGGKDYYDWLLRRFLPTQVKANVAPHRKVEFQFFNLVPNGVDNIFRSVETFLAELFGLEMLPGARWLDRAVPHKSRMTQPRRRYLTAWQGGFTRVSTASLRPLSVHDLRGGGVRVDFEIVYTATFEDRSTKIFAGPGEAYLTLEKLDWRLSGLSFPGFLLPQPDGPLKQITPTWQK